VRAISFLDLASQSFVLRLSDGGTTHKINELASSHDLAIDFTDQLPDQSPPLRTMPDDTPAHNAPCAFLHARKPRHDTVQMQAYAAKAPLTSLLTYYQTYSV